MAKIKAQSPSVDSPETIAPQIGPDPAMLAISKVFSHAAEQEQGADQEYLRKLAKLAALKASPAASEKVEAQPFDLEAIDLRVERRIRAQVEALKAQGLEGKDLEQAIRKIAFQ